MATSTNYGWPKPVDGDGYGNGKPWGQAFRDFIDDADTRVHRLESAVVDVRRYGAKGDGVTDDTAAINAATAYANGLSLGSVTVPYDTIRKGGTVVELPPGRYLTSGTLHLYDGVILRGAGKHSTIIQSSYDGPVFRNVLANYDMQACGLQDMTIQGDRSLTGQVGLDLLRDWWGQYSGLFIYNCGSDGIRMYQCICTHMEDVECVQNVGHGLLIASGFNSWADPTANNLPSNACMFTNCHYANNDGAGVKATGQVNGCAWAGGSSESNYWASGSNAGYNLEWLAVATVPSEFSDFWTEGPVKAHVLLNSYANNPLRLTRWHHFGNGASGNVDRAAIVTLGTLHLNGAYGHGSSYKSINSSTAPFRVNKGGPGILYARDIYGSTVSTPYHAEDVDGATTGLTNYFYMDNMLYQSGPRRHYADYGQITQLYYQTGGAHPWLAIENYYKAVGWGPGNAAIDTYLTRSGVRTLAMGTAGGSQFFDMGASWNGNHALMGAYHLWVDGSGRLRIKSGAPTSDTDGTVVGTQS